MHPQGTVKTSGGSGDKEFKQWFERIDTNRDGKINKEDLKKALKDSGYKFTALRTWFSFNHCDLNHNNMIDGEKEVALFIDYAKKNWGKVIVAK